MKQKYKRLIPMTLYVKNQMTLVDNDRITKEKSFDNIKNYSNFLSQELILDMVMGENVIIKGFKPTALIFDGDCQKTLKGNKGFDFWKQKGGHYICREYPTIECLVRYDTDVIESCLPIDLK